jgi:hypothetical protein
LIKWLAITYHPSEESRDAIFSQIQTPFPTRKLERDGVGTQSQAEGALKTCV